MDGPASAACPLPRVVISCYLDTSAAKVMLAEAKPDPTSSSTAGSAPAFNPTAAEFHEVAQRLSRSGAMARWNSLQLQIKLLQKFASGSNGREAKQASSTELASLHAELGEAESALAELQATFNSDPLALASWMQALFTLADEGFTALEARGPEWMHAQDLTAVLGDAQVPAVSAPAEHLLAAFKRRFELERGAARQGRGTSGTNDAGAGVLQPSLSPSPALKVILRLAPNCFAPTFSAEAAMEAAVERSRERLLGPDAVADGGVGSVLDLVSVSWLDFEGHDVLSVLRALAKMTVNKGNADGSKSPRVRGIGLVDFPWPVIQAALRAGIPVASCHLRYCLMDTESAPVVALCQAAGVDVLATGTLAAGLISCRWLGVACPCTDGPMVPAVTGATAAVSAVAPARSSSPMAMSLGHCSREALDMVAKYGGWPRLQQLLRCILSIAQRRGVSMEAVAVRWAMDKGVTPVVDITWDDAAGGALATFGWPYGCPQHAAIVGKGGGQEAKATAKGALPQRPSHVDAVLLAEESFLMPEDIAELEGSRAVQGCAD